MLDRIERLGKPVIAAVNGFALGGGCELAMACHVRVASENARLGTPEVKLGIMCGYAGTQRLPRLVGKGRALEMLLTGEMVDAQEALRIGLVNRVVPKEKLLAEAEALLRKMLANGPVSLRFTLEAVNDGPRDAAGRGAVPGGHALRPHLHDRGHEGRHARPSSRSGRRSSRASEAQAAAAASAPGRAAGLRVRRAARAPSTRAVVDGLLDGRARGAARRWARRRGRDAWSRCRAPSSCRSPRAAAARSGRFDAMVALGAVIRGETDHYEHIAREAAAGPGRGRARDGRARRLRRADGGRARRRPSRAPRRAPRTRARRRRARRWPWSHVAARRCERHAAGRG